MTVGVVGLGLIGGSFAKAYHEKGHTVLAHNRGRSVYDFAVMSGAVDGELTKENIAKLYRIPIENIRTLAHMDAACGVKITILRTTPSGTVGDRDVYGAQQAAPLMDLMIP